MYEWDIIDSNTGEILVANVPEDQVEEYLYDESVSARVCYNRVWEPDGTAA